MPRTITKIRVHPAIGIARVGDSVEHFVAPERYGAPPVPPRDGQAGGFKDAQGRVRRQAQRFRVFAYYDDHSVHELTAQDAEITWKVHVVNRKATHHNNRGVDERDQIIDPGEQSLTVGNSGWVWNPNQMRKFDQGQIRLSTRGEPARKVPLGDMRVEPGGQLLVCGGFGVASSFDGQAMGGMSDNPKWYDDVSDGTVKATVKLHGQHQAIEAMGAWVVVGPPKFAPYFDTPTTLYDRILQMAVSQGRTTPRTRPSYPRDVRPILQRAHIVRWVNAAGRGHHLWTEPISQDDAKRIVAKVKKPDGSGPGNMPAMSGRSQLTAVQYKYLEQWSRGDVDYTPLPVHPLTPAELDEVALSGTVGAAFAPGIEAGGFNSGNEADLPILKPDNFHATAEDWGRLREDRVRRGDITARMSMPWHNDFFLCGHTWWPVPRPNDVRLAGSPEYKAWVRSVGGPADMAKYWSRLGFVVKVGGEYLEQGHVDAPMVAQRTFHLDFGAVPQQAGGAPGWLARELVFEVRTTDAPLTLQVLPDDTPRSPRLRLGTSSVTVPAGSAATTVRLPVLYQTGPVGDTVHDQVVVRDDTGQQWIATLSASTAPPRRVATTLVLDPGTTGLDQIGAAAAVFLDLAGADHGIAAVRADLAESARRVDTDGGQDALRELIALDQGPASSVTDALTRAESVFGDTGYDDQVVVALTSGDAPPPDSSDHPVHVLSLATPAHPHTRALYELSGNSGGALLHAGLQGPHDLSRQVLQVLADVTGAQVVLDTEGVLAGTEQRIPFNLSEVDGALDVVLLTADPAAVEFRLLTPNGYLLDPPRAAELAEVSHSTGSGAARYRVPLPVELVPERYDRAGTWHAVLTPAGSDAPFGAVDPAASADATLRPYALVVHAHSALGLAAHAEQRSFEVGADIAVHAELTEGGLAARPGAAAWAEVTRPDGTTGTVTLTEGEPGRFSGTVPAQRGGGYRIRVRAQATSPLGYPAQREQTVTAAVWRGGDREPAPLPMAAVPIARGSGDQGVGLAAASQARA